MTYHRAQRDQREGGAPAAGFGFGDLQQPVHHLDQIVDLLDGEAGGSSELCGAAAGPERLFEPAADAPQRVLRS